MCVHAKNVLNKQMLKLDVSLDFISNSVHFRSIIIVFHTLDTPGSTALLYMCRTPIINKVLRNITGALGCLYCLPPS